MQFSVDHGQYSPFEASYALIAAYFDYGKYEKAYALLNRTIEKKAQPSFSDPARFGFAHGGKDGIPYPVDRQTYDQSIQLLRKAVTRAKIEGGEKRRAINRLDDWHHNR